jgi:DMSO/TMAO reductase YedYZ molybdopterin-dependent catalytic subunit
MSSGRESLVEKRMRWLERKRAEGPRNAPAGPPLGRAPANRHGMPQVPIGQRVVPNWPVLDLGVQPAIARDAWRLEVGGLCARPFTLDWAGLLELPQVEEQSDFHCVTTWSALDQRWRGVRFRELAERAEPLPEAEFVLCTGADSDPGSGEAYTTNLPLLDALQPDVLLVHGWNGGPLPREHGGPVRMITPRLYAWKGAKWLVRIEFLAEDAPGFWERRGYSNSGDPWRNERFQS